MAARRSMINALDLTAKMEMTMTLSLREKNLAYLDREMDSLAKMLRVFQPVWTLVPEGEPNGPNLRIGDGQLLYKENARAATEKQLKLFDRAPNRIVFNAPERVKKYELPAHEEGAFLTQRYDDRATDDHHGIYVAEISEDGEEKTA